jgi:beta-galactosidase
MDSTMFVNGVKVGSQPYGYTSFQFDITDQLNFGNTPNVVAVKVDYRNSNTRWYSGAGIYRDVWLTVTDPVRVNFNGTYVTTEGSEVIVDTEVMNSSGASAQVSVKQTIAVTWKSTDESGAVNDSAIITADASGVAAVKAVRNGDFYVTTTVDNGSRYSQAFGRMKFTAPGNICSAQRSVC